MLEYNKQVFIIGGHMQVLKEKTRETINKAALVLFREYGYQKVSMRQIAKASEMTVGNIYRYYLNKDELFETLLLPTISAIEALISKDMLPEVLNAPLEDVDFDKKMIQLFLEIHQHHSDELYILVHGCEESRLGKTIDSITSQLSEKLHVLIALNTQTDLEVDSSYLANLIAKSIINNCVEILYDFDDDEKRYNHMVRIIRAFTGSYFKTF